MNKKLFIFLVVIVLISIIVVVVLLPKDDMCSDDIRGYEKKASSSLSILRKKFSEINTTIETENNLSVTKLEGLNATIFATLRVNDTQCKLLNRCLRFVILKPPSEACPTEYTDYQDATTSSLDRLEKLKRLQLATEKIAHEVNSPVSSIHSRISELSDAINPKPKKIKPKLLQDILNIKQQMDNLISEGSESKEK